MATLSKTRNFGKPMFFETVTSGPAKFPLDPAFDSELEAPSGLGQNWTLRLTLRIFYQRMTPQQVTTKMMAGWGGAPLAVATALVRDANKTPSLIKDWSVAEWAYFINTARTHASYWDSKFWLIPPNEVTYFDVFDPRGARTRPNVICEFEFLVVAAENFAHRTISVYNLATHNFFRSDNATYDSDDVKIQTSNADKDQTGAIINANQWAVTHEVGHALGLPHINVLRSHPDCGLAVMIDKQNRDPKLPRIPLPSPNLAGGSNSTVCYGPGSTADAINNIMGQGMRFTSDDAKPWLDRLPEHLDLSGVDRGMFSFNLAKWKVAMAPAPPRAVR